MQECFWVICLVSYDLHLPVAFLARHTDSIPASLLASPQILSCLACSCLLSLALARSHLLSLALTCSHPAPLLCNSIWFSFRQQTLQLSTCGHGAISNPDIYSEVLALLEAEQYAPYATKCILSGFFPRPRLRVFSIIAMLACLISSLCIRTVFRSANRSYISTSIQ